MQAYVGVAKDLNAIVIAFRGTQEHRYSRIGQSSQHLAKTCAVYITNLPLHILTWCLFMHIFLFVW